MGFGLILPLLYAMDRLGLNALTGIDGIWTSYSDDQGATWVDMS